jgi:hypothetical protein
MSDTPKEHDETDYEMIERVFNSDPKLRAALAEKICGPQSDTPRPRTVTEADLNWLEKLVRTENDEADSARRILADLDAPMWEDETVVTDEMIEAAAEEWYDGEQERPGEWRAMPNSDAEFAKPLYRALMRESLIAAMRMRAGWKTTPPKVAQSFRLICKDTSIAGVYTNRTVKPNDK